MACSPKMMQSELQPKSGALLVVGGSVDGTVDGGTVVGEVLAVVGLVLAVVGLVLADVEAGAVTRDVSGLVAGLVVGGASSGACVGAAVLVVVSVAVRVKVRVAVRVTVLASVVVSGSVPVCVTEWDVGVSVAVEGFVVSCVVVGGHPLDSCLQHQAFQSGVHAHSQMSASAWQS